MKVSQEKLPASQVGLAIEIPPEKSKQVFEKVLANLARSSNIPGFRRGKAPRHILLQQYGSRRLKAAVLDELIQETVNQALTQEAIPAMGQFELSTGLETLIEQFQPGEPFTFNGVIDVQPEVKLNQYTDFELAVEPVQYDPQQVEEHLKSYQDEMANLVPLDGDRPAEAGDVVVIDHEGYFRVDGNGEEADLDPLPGGSAENLQVDLGEKFSLPGLVDGIVGMNLGETRDIDTCFPSDYPQTDLAGKSVVFKVTLKEIKLKEIPELNDEFAQTVSDFDTLKELRASLEQDFQNQAARQTQAKKEQAVLDALLEQLEVELPESLVQSQVKLLLELTLQELERKGLDPKQVSQDILINLQRELHPRAIAELKQFFALTEVGRQESLELDSAKADRRSRELLAQYPQERRPDLKQLRASVEDSLFREQVLAWLLEHNTFLLEPLPTTNGSEEQESPSDPVAALEETPGLGDDPENSD